MTTCARNIPGLGHADDALSEAHHDDLCCRCFARDIESNPVPMYRATLRTSPLPPGHVDFTSDLCSFCEQNHAIGYINTCEAFPANCGICWEEEICDSCLADGSKMLPHFSRYV